MPCSRHRRPHPSTTPRWEPRAPHRRWSHRRQLAGRHRSYLGRINENELIFHCLYCLFPIAYIAYIACCLFPCRDTNKFRQVAFPGILLVAIPVVVVSCSTSHHGPSSPNGAMAAGRRCSGNLHGNSHLGRMPQLTSTRNTREVQSLHEANIEEVKTS